MDKNINNHFVHLELALNSWLLSVVYGPVRASDYPTFWNRFITIPNRFTLPWMIVGDLNDTLVTPKG